MGEALFLSRKEIEDLTGYKVKPKQIAELRRQGVPFKVNRRGKGRIVVRRDYNQGRRESEFELGTVA